MSEQELKKWERKANLWIKLHSGLVQEYGIGRNILTCSFICEIVSCPYHGKGKNCFKNPNKLRLGLLKEDLSTFKCVSCDELKDNPIFAGCVDWVRYV